MIFVYCFSVPSGTTDPINLDLSEMLVFRAATIFRTWAGAHFFSLICVKRYVGTNVLLPELCSARQCVYG
jgi:hypothetical protein